MRGQCHQCMGLTSPHDELDFDSIRLINLHHGAKITSLEMMLGDVAFQYDGIQHLDGHFGSPGYAVINRGKFSPLRTIQTVTKYTDLPFGPVILPRISYFCPYLVDS